MLAHEVGDDAVVAFGIVQPEVRVTALFEPYDILILAAAFRKKLAAARRNGKLILFAENEQNRELELIDKLNRRGFVNIRAAVFSYAKHNEVKHGEQRAFIDDHVLTEGLAEGDIRSFGNDTLNAFRAVGRSKQKERRGGSDTDGMEKDLFHSELIFKQLYPDAKVSALADAEGVIFTVAFTVSAGIDDKNITADLLIGFGKIIGILMAFGSAGKNDNTALFVAEIEILTVKL